jgi:hypothetical protein
MRNLYLAALLAALAACRDLSSFTSNGDHYEGEVIAGEFVRSGVLAGTKLCLVLDAERFEDAPGFLSTDDGRFRRAALRPIPQLWRDALSTLSFGEGRLKNLLYAVADSSPGAGDAFAVVSLMQSGGVEVRLLRSAPPILSSDAGVPTATADDAGQTLGQDAIFAVFVLERQKGPCSF